MSDVTVSLVDYNMGNIQSIYNALRVVTEDIEIVSRGSEIESPDAIVVPGVGSFAEGMQNLRQQGFIDPLNRFVIEEGTPYLGICLGLQFLADRSTEGGIHEGLGWIPGEINRIDTETDEYRVPHMGWNEVDIGTETDSELFRNFEPTEVFYFLHSYHMDPETVDDRYTTSTAWHGTDITASVRSDNIFGVQFHPEKSQGTGLKVIENFIYYVKRGDDL
jgi:glutamine amidotransferase